MARYNHAFDLAFSVISNDPEGRDVDAAMLRAAVLKRVEQLDLETAYGGWEEACGAPFDTYQEDSDDGLSQ